MKIIIIFFFIFLVACSTKPDTEKKRVSYSMGQQIAANILQSKIEVDVSVLNQSIKDGLTGKKSALSESELQEAFSVMQGEIRKKIDAEAEKNRQQGIKYLTANRQKPGVKVTASGLQYEVLKEGQGKKPKLESLVQVHFKGSLINASIFDSTLNRGPMEFKVKNTFPGLMEGMQLMHEGSIFRFYVPPALAYGAQERPGIPAQSVLIYEITLLKVKSF